MSAMAGIQALDSHERPELIWGLGGAEWLPGRLRTRHRWIPRRWFSKKEEGSGSIAKPTQFGLSHLLAADLGRPVWAGVMMPEWTVGLLQTQPWRPGKWELRPPGCGSW